LLLYWSVLHDLLDLAVLLEAFLQGALRVLVQAVHRHRDLLPLGVWVDRLAVPALGLVFH
jgi:hypothetical protein